MGKLTHTVKGPIASFRSADVAPIESLKLHFLPKQEGSGDPSPINIRPITGWTGCNLFGSGRNLFNIDRTAGTLSGYTPSTIRNFEYNKYYPGLAHSGYYNTSYITSYTVDAVNKIVKITSTANGYGMAFPMPCKGGQTYYIYCKVADDDETVLRFNWFTKNGEYIQNASSKPSNRIIKKNITVPTNASILCIDFMSPNGVERTYSDIYIGLLDLNEYVPFTKLETIPLSWSSHGAEYGGYIDPVRGKLVAEYGYVEYDGSQDEGWEKVSSGSASVFAMTIRSSLHKKNNLVQYCNYLKPIAKNATWGNYDNWISYGDNNFVTGIQSITTVEDWKEYLSENHLYVCYELATPIEYDLTPTELQTFLDYNNFWSDTNDDTEVEYAFRDHLSGKKPAMNEPHIATATSAPVASFSTDMRAPIVDLKAHFTPVQEGTGDPSPTNVRPIHGFTEATIRSKGKNLIDKDALTGTDKVWWKGKVVGGYPNHCVTPKIPVKPGVAYRLNRNSASHSYVCYFDKNGDYVDQQTWDDYNPSRIIPDGVYYVGITIGTEYLDNPAPQFELGSTATAYEEFVAGSEIPIEFTATKNLLDTSKVLKMIGGATFSYSEGSWSFENCGSGNGSAVWGSQVFPAGTYTMKATPSRDGVRGFRLLCSSASCGGQWLDWYEGYFIDSSNGTDKITFTTTESFKIGLCFLNNSQHLSSPGTLKDIQLELGSTATEYEPYGTVYGGYIDLVRNKIVAEWKKKILDGSEHWGIYGDETEGYSFRIVGNSDLNDRKLGYQVSKCSMYKNIDGCWGSGYKNATGIYSDHTTVKSLYFRSPDGIITTLSDFKQWLANNKPELCYKLATPIEYDLTHQQIKTFIGTNNIWSDLNGNIEAKYWTH